MSGQLTCCACNGQKDQAVAMYTLSRCDMCCVDAKLRLTIDNSSVRQLLIKCTGAKLVVECVEQRAHKRNPMTATPLVA